MRALLSLTPGGPETLVVQDVPPPQPNPGEVVVRVIYCAVNFPDSLIIEDRYQYKPARPFSPGAEIAGIVEFTAPDVAWPRPGDAVMAMPGWGGMAEQICLPAKACLPKPHRMSFAEAAGFIMTYGTSYHALVQRAAIQPNEKLLVLGAAGGVGIAALELGRALGAEVIAAVSSQEKLQTALAHGATRGFVYDREFLSDESRRGLAARIKAECGGVDVVYDAVGGALSEAAARALNWGGRLLIVGFPAGIAKLPLNLLMLKGAGAIGVFYGSFTEKEPELNAANNLALLALFEQGKIRPHISSRYSLAQGGEAIAHLGSRLAQGKIVVRIGDEP